MKIKRKNRISGEGDLKEEQPEPRFFKPSQLPNINLIWSIKVTKLMNILWFSSHME